MLKTTMTHSMILAGLAGGMLLLSGCGQKETTPPASNQTPSTPQTALPDAQKNLAAAADQVKDAAQKGVAEAQSQLTDSASAAQAKVQGILDRAKGLVAEKKYTEALSLLQQELAGLKLTADQQKLVDGLKAEVQKLMASSTAKDAGKALGDLVKPPGQ